MFLRGRGGRAPGFSFPCPSTGRQWVLQKPRHFSCFGHNEHKLSGCHSVPGSRQLRAAPNSISWFVAGAVSTRLLERSHCLSHLCTREPKNTQAGGGSRQVWVSSPAGEPSTPRHHASVHPGSTFLLGAGLLSYFSVVWPRASFCLCSGTCLIRNTC